jgi:flagellar basal-body rod protein FlgB
MPLTFDDGLGIHMQAVLLRARRSEVLAANLVNADTPHYLARDMDFRAALGQAGDRIAMQVTHVHHSPGGQDGPAALLYRVPMQPAVDGNTVDPHVEKTAFMQNALQYEVSLTFLGGRINTLLAAIRGE